MARCVWRDEEMTTLPAPLSGVSSLTAPSTAAVVEGHLMGERKWRHLLLISMNQHQIFAQKQWKRKQMHSYGYISMSVQRVEHVFGVSCRMVPRVLHQEAERQGKRNRQPPRR